MLRDVTQGYMMLHSMLQKMIETICKLFCIYDIIIFGGWSVCDKFWSSAEQNNYLTSVLTDQMNCKKNILIWTEVNFPPFFKNHEKCIKNSLWKKKCISSTLSIEIQNIC